MKTLFVLSGGGLRGLDIHCGMLLALERAGIKPDAIAGCSAGAIAGAFLAADYSAEDFYNILYPLKDSDVIRKRFAWMLRIKTIQYMSGNASIETILKDYLPEKFEGLKTPLYISATNDADNTNVLLRSGDLKSAVMASAAIRGIFPTVEREGICLSDGATTDNLPVPLLYGFDFDRIIFLIVQSSKLYTKHDDMLTRALTSIDALIEDALHDSINMYSRTFSLKQQIVLWPAHLRNNGSFRFDHGLINESYTFAKQALANKGLFSCPT